MQALAGLCHREGAYLVIMTSWMHIITQLLTNKQNDTIDFEIKLLNIMWEITVWSDIEHDYVIAEYHNWNPEAIGYLQPFFFFTMAFNRLHVQCCNHIPKSGSAALMAVIQPSIPPSVSLLRQVTYWSPETVIFRLVIQIHTVISISICILCTWDSIASYSLQASLLLVDSGRPSDCHAWKQHMHNRNHTLCEVETCWPRNIAWISFLPSMQY